MKISRTQKTVIGHVLALSSLLLSYLVAIHFSDRPNKDVGIFCLLMYPGAHFSLWLHYASFGTNFKKNPYFLDVGYSCVIISFGLISLFMYANTQTG